MKIRTVGAYLFHADGHVVGETEQHYWSVAFRNFENAPEVEKM